MVFSCNGKSVDPSTSIYEILKEKGSIKKIHFAIKDKTDQSKNRADSLQLTNRIRSKSLFVDQISTESANAVVKGLITENFKVFGPDFQGGPATK